MIKAFIEIPAYSKYKYELDKETNKLILDRPLNQMIPANYGFIENTLAEDGDQLDVFVVTNNSLVPGTYCKIYLIGIMICKDQGINDHKLIAGVIAEHVVTSWNEELERIETYLRTYKPNFELISYSNKTDALQELQACQNRYNMIDPFMSKI